MHISRRTLLKMGAAAAMTSVWPALAQQYPTKPVRLILPSSPGTTIDVNGRYIAEQLGKRLGTSFVVENHAGAASEAI